MINYSGERYTAQEIIYEIIHKKHKIDDRLEDEKLKSIDWLEELLNL